MTGKRGRVLIIAGSDSSGGAGVQADIKTVTALGGYAATAITAITVQNTRGVESSHPLAPELVAAQIRAVATDIGADAVKIGMLGGAATVEAVARALKLHAPNAPVILDPVMVAKGGQALLDADAVAALLLYLVPGAALVTPNAPEAERLTGLKASDLAGQDAAARALLARGAMAALVKGGHIPGDVLTDVLATSKGVETFTAERIVTRATHGTGCTYASAIAASVAQGATLVEAVQTAHAYLQEAIRRAPGFGSGHGPVDHGWPCRRD